MRSTRNASKNTPPAKKTGKGTPSKGTPKTAAAETKEDLPKVETDPIVASDAELVNPPDSALANVSKEDKPDDAVGAERVEEAYGSKSKPLTTKKKGGTPKRKADEIPQKEVVPSESKPESGQEAIKEVKGHASEQADPTPVEALPTDVTESKKTASEQAEPTSIDGSKDIEVSIAVEEERTDDKVSQQGGQDEEMQEEDVGMDGVEDEEDEDDDEQDDNGEEEGDDEDEAEEDVVEERPVTERQKRKKLEVFVGGLDKEATAEEVKKTFEAVGEVVEVRLTAHPQSGKNRGYAFVRFATVDQASRASAELDRVKIRDKECAVVPSEDNDTLFVGNLCKSWSSDQVLEKLKEYGVDGIDNMFLLEDHEHEGHNKGHAFLEFVTHNDAVKAFKRLSKPDAIFGCDRSARVAWAEGSSAPDEATMAKVKSVFVDGMPAEWDDGKLREHFGKHGDIERIALAKNIPKSKRQDYAFVNYATRDAAVAAIEALNGVELADGDKQVKLKVELSKPAPRKKRIRGHRGAYPVGGQPSKARKGKGTAPVGARSDRRRGEGGPFASRGGRAGRGGSQKNSRGDKRKVAEEGPLREERPLNKHHRGSKFPRTRAAVPRGNQGARVGGSGAHSDEDYLPMGARMTPHFAASRDYSRRPLREAAYPRRDERDLAYSGPGSKRPYSVLDEEAAYYGAPQRGYPRARVEYADPALGGVPLYSDSLRAAPLGHNSLGHVLPSVRGTGYASALPGAAEYDAYGPGGVADPRGPVYPSNYAGSRVGAGYSLQGGAGPYY